MIRPLHPRSTATSISLNNKTRPAFFIKLTEKQKEVHRRKLSLSFSKKWFPYNSLEIDLSYWCPQLLVCSMSIKTFEIVHFMSRPYGQAKMLCHAAEHLVYTFVPPRLLPTPDSVVSNNSTSNRDSQENHVFI